MPNFLRKLIGFTVGAGLCFYLLFIIFASAGLAPRGPGLILFVIFFGVVGARIANTPKAFIEGAKNSFGRLSLRWWGLEKGLRLSIFMAVLWVIGAHIWIERYDRSFANSYAPALLILVVYFGYSLFVKNPVSRVVAPVVATPEPSSDVGGDSLVEEANGRTGANSPGPRVSENREQELNDYINRMTPPRR